jgi:hypothetical protein
MNSEWWYANRSMIIFWYSVSRSMIISSWSLNSNIISVWITASGSTISGWWNGNGLEEISLYLKMWRNKSMTTARQTIRQSGRRCSGVSPLTSSCSVDSSCMPSTTAKARVNIRAYQHCWDQRQITMPIFTAQHGLQSFLRSLRQLSLISNCHLVTQFTMNISSRFDSTLTLQPSAVSANALHRFSAYNYILASLRCPIYSTWPSNQIVFGEQ